jgi:hypothetical protein
MHCTALTLIPRFEQLLLGTDRLLETPEVYYTLLRLPGLLCLSKSAYVMTFFDLVSINEKS